MTLLTVLIAGVVGEAVIIGGLIYALHRRDRPLIEQHEHVTADYVDGKIYASPSYHVRIVQK